MTRVLMVADGLWNGGAERQMALLASSLPEPWSASVLSMEDGPYRRVIEDLGIGVVLAPRRYRFDVTPALRMWRAASCAGADVVHAWGWMSTLAMVPYCRAHGIPLVAGTIRRGDQPPRRARMYRLGMALSDAVVANSKAGLAAFGFADSARGRVIYNGFDPARLAAITVRHASRASEDSVDPRTVAIMAARMSRVKDWRVLIEAARRLAAEPGGWRFLAVGSGPECQDLMAEASDLVEAGVMEFPHGGTEVLPTIAGSDIGLLLTDPRLHAEGCSNSIMEYMACGLPVVCTDSGGNPELVQDGVNGLLVAPRDAAALVSALRTLRDDPARAAEMGREGRRRIEDRFTVESMVSQWVDLYGALVGTQGRTRP